VRLTQSLNSWTLSHSTVFENRETYDASRPLRGRFKIADLTTQVESTGGSNPKLSLLQFFLRMDREYQKVLQEQS
jgi:hypothetical protein